MKRLLVADTDFPELEIERGVAAAHGIELVALEDEQSLGDVADDLAGSVDAVMVQWGAVSSDDLDRLPSVRAIGRLGVGLDQIDVEAASRRGIAVVNSGDYATEEVAIHALTLILSVLRRIGELDAAVRSGGWFSEELVSGVHRVSDLTLGVVGLGRIGRRVAELGRSLGMTTVAYDPAQADDPLVVEDLATLLGSADVVTLHVPLTDATRGLIGARELARMRRGSVLVNVSRGGLIDEQAVLAALEDGHLGGAGIDVFEREPLPSDHPLTGAPRTVLTPHAAYYSSASIVDARRRPVEGIAAVLEGRRPPNQVN